MKKLISIFGLDSSPSLYFFKIYYLFGIVTSIYFIAVHGNMFEEQSRTFNMIFIGIGIMSFIGYILNYFKRSYSEMDLSKIFSAFCFASFVASCSFVFNGTINHDLLGMKHFLIMLFCLTSFYRNRFLKDEIASFNKIVQLKETMEEILEESEVKDGEH